MGKLPFAAIVACGLVAALPIRLQAQQAGSDEVTLGPGAVASRTAGSDPARGSLPAWPPESGGIFRMFREDLSKPLTPGQKLTRAIKQALFPGLIGTAAAAGLGMATDTRLDHDYGMGGRGFVRRWGSAVGENSVGVFVGDFALASMFHQDPRYHPDKNKGFGHRLGHALAAVVVTRSDSGSNEFNSSHLLGILVATGAATAWHHPSDRNARFFGERFGYDVASSALYKVISEFLFYKNEPRK